MENINKIENKKISEFTYEEVLTNLTFINRRDRFCSGGLYNDVKNGIVLKLLLRLKEIIDNTKIKEGDTNMNYLNEEKETIINNEFDYSTCIASFENIGYLIQYCEAIYNNFTKLVQEDEEKNERLKEEFKNYTYHKSYSMGFEVIIRLKSFESIRYKDYQSYFESYKTGNISNISSLQIEMSLDYRRGMSNSLKEHENKFKISFKPYEIKFGRRSNYNEANINSVENSINEILKKFPSVNTIFCSK